MYFYEILTRTKTNRHSISMLLITYKFLNNTVSFYLQFKWEGRCVSVGESVYAHASAASITPAMEKVFL